MQRILQLRFTQLPRYSFIQSFNTLSSHVIGKDTIKLIEEPIYNNFKKIALKYSSNEALVSVDQNLRWTYADLLKEVDLFANGLRDLGLVKGDRFGVWLGNRSEWLVTQLATAKEGIILVNINPAYREDELVHCLNSVGCKALLLEENKRTNNIEMLKNLIPNPSEGNLKSEVFPELKSLIIAGERQLKGYISYEVLRKSDQNTATDQNTKSIDCDDPINIQFTSGTTGNPKGATLTHKGILNNGYIVGEQMKLTSKDRLCIPVPLYHCFGMVLGNLACLTHGATMIYPSSSFNALKTIEVVQKEKATGLHGVPTMFINELNLPNFKKFDLSSLRTGIMAGSICPVHTVHKVIKDMNMKEFIICYGMTETSPISFQTDIDDDPILRSETVGRILPHLEAKIVNEKGETLPRNACGELLTKGYSIMRGYWNNEQKTKEAIDEEGFMHTGDLATIDDNGYCRIVGRIKDVIIRGGENIYPRDLEDAFIAHEEVENAAVVGVPDEVYGEEICAFIIKKPESSLTEENIRNFIRHSMAYFKVPKYVFFVKEFPLTVTGKIQKFCLRDKAVQILGDKGRCLQEIKLESNN